LAALQKSGFNRRDFLKGAGTLVVGFRPSVPTLMRQFSRS